jgi:Arc/MetJ-type ribon-helix-helix transcriptional regulator
MTMALENMVKAQITLDVPLPHALTEFITSRVAPGCYQSATEVIRPGPRLLEQDEATLPGSNRTGHNGNLQTSRGHLG